MKNGTKVSITFLDQFSYQPLPCQNHWFRGGCAPINLRALLRLEKCEFLLPLKTLLLSIKPNDSKVVNNGVKTFVDVANWEPFKSVAKLYVVLVISSRGAAEARSFLWAISISGPISHNFSPLRAPIGLFVLRASEELSREGTFVRRNVIQGAQGKESVYRCLS